VIKKIFHILFKKGDPFAHDPWFHGFAKRSLATQPITELSPETSARTYQTPNKRRAKRRRFLRKRRKNKKHEVNRNMYYILLISIKHENFDKTIEVDYYTTNIAYI